MSYIPNTEEQQLAMVDSIGFRTISELFSDIPKSLLAKPLDLPSPLAESKLVKHMQRLAAKNMGLDQLVCFLGAGAYDHLRPSVIPHLAGRGEFLTAYTPYQAEISQGTLQAIFEFQTLIAELTGMEAANASMYDGATALAEAALLACNVTRRSKVALPENLHPEWTSVVRIYLESQNIETIMLPYDSASGCVQLPEATESWLTELAAVVLQQPNFFGCIEDVDPIASWIKSHQGLLIMAVDPISLGLLKSPGAYGADIVVGDGGVLGNPISYGGPSVGFFAVSGSGLIRRMPGRIVGETADAKGNRGYVLTLQTREQHIRREKATSNICTNQALNALVATIYLSLVGKSGLKQIAYQCLQKTAYLRSVMEKVGFRQRFSAPFFKEVAFTGEVNWQDVQDHMIQQGYLSGLPLNHFYNELSDSVLMAVTEARTKEEIDEFASLLGGYARGSKN